VRNRGLWVEADGESGCQEGLDSIFESSGANLEGIRRRRREMDDMYEGISVMFPNRGCWSFSPGTDRANAL
jgi:hypothetical protein